MGNNLKMLVGQVPNLSWQKLQHMADAEVEAFNRKHLQEVKMGNNLEGSGTPADVRGSTHGNFEGLAYTAQQLKKVMRDSDSSWSDLRSAQRESLEMIATKIARILNGDPDFDDHWDDIAGYAKLGKIK